MACTVVQSQANSASSARLWAATRHTSLGTVRAFPCRSAFALPSPFVPLSLPLCLFSPFIPCSLFNSYLRPFFWFIPSGFLSPISSFSFSSYFHFCPLLVIAVFLRFCFVLSSFHILLFPLKGTERESLLRVSVLLSLPSSHFPRFPLLAASLPLLGSHTESHQSYSNIERTLAMETIFLQTVYVSIYIFLREIFTFFFFIKVLNLFFSI